jgi:hypothetical protein
MIKNFNQFLNEKEMCWSIKEERPIKVKIRKATDRSSGNWWLIGDSEKEYIIEPEPMTMTYETYYKLGDNLSQDQIDYGLSNGRTYDEKTLKYPNDVHKGTYDYSNGETYFVAPTEKDLENWLNFYKDVVVRI